MTCELKVKISETGLGSATKLHSLQRTTELLKHCGSLSDTDKAQSAEPGRTEWVCWGHWCIYGSVRIRLCSGPEPEPEQQPWSCLHQGFTVRIRGEVTASANQAHVETDPPRLLSCSPCSTTAFNQGHIFWRSAGGFWPVSFPHTFLSRVRALRQSTPSCSFFFFFFTSPPL